MAISFLKGAESLLAQPAQLSFSGNPMIFKIQTEIDPATRGTYFVGYLDDRQLQRKAGDRLFFEVDEELVEFKVMTCFCQMVRLCQTRSQRNGRIRRILISFNILDDSHYRVLVGHGCERDEKVLELTVVG